MPNPLISPTTTMGDIAIKFLQHGVASCHLTMGISSIGSASIALTMNDGTVVIGSGRFLWEALNDALIKATARIGASF